MNRKDEIRHVIQLKRAALTLGEIQEKSKQVIEHLSQFDLFTQASALAGFYPKTFEVQLAPLIERCLREKRPVCVPRHRDAARGYDWSWVSPSEAWRDGPYRIAEPARLLPVDPSEINLVLVPAVAVDRKGNRLGHGGGNVDRLLQGLDCPCIAVVFDFQIRDDIPTESHDVAIQYIASESGIHRVQA